jgi:hypothetical protein
VSVTDYMYNAGSSTPAGHGSVGIDGPARWCTGIGGSSRAVVGTGPLWHRPPVVSGGGVVVDAGQGGGVDVNGGLIQAGDTVDQLVRGLVCDRVSFNHSEHRLRSG